MPGDRPLLRREGNPRFPDRGRARGDPRIPLLGTLRGPSTSRREEQGDGPLGRMAYLQRPLHAPGPVHRRQAAVPRRRVPPAPIAGGGGPPLADGGTAQPMSVLLAAGLVLVAFTAAAGMGVAWRTWRRLAVLRLNLGSLEDRVGALEEDVLGLARFALLVRYREKGHQVPERRIPLQSHSQHGEDALLWELLGEKTSGYYV